SFSASAMPLVHQTASTTAFSTKLPSTAPRIHRMSVLPPPERQVVEQRHGGRFLARLPPLDETLFELLALPLLPSPRDQAGPAFDHLLREPPRLDDERPLAHTLGLLERAVPEELLRRDAADDRRRLGLARPLLRGARRRDPRARVVDRRPRARHLVL